MLIRSILTEPADEAPRLVYADWLDENGFPTRAAFIRSSIAFHGTGTRADVFARALAACGITSLDNTAWAGSGLDLAWHEGDLSIDEWDRGFVSGVRCPIDTFLKRAKEIFLTQPIVDVTLRDREPRLESGFWGWTLEIQNDSSATPGDAPVNAIPPCLMVPFLHASRQSPPSQPGAFYLTPEIALAALSNACVAYGRQLAELPPLAPLPS